MKVWLVYMVRWFVKRSSTITYLGTRTPISGLLSLFSNSNWTKISLADMGFHKCFNYFAVFVSILAAPNPRFCIPDFWNGLLLPNRQSASQLSVPSWRYLPWLCGVLIGQFKELHGLEELSQISNFNLHDRSCILDESTFHNWASQVGCLLLASW